MYIFLGDESVWVGVFCFGCTEYLSEQDNGLVETDAEIPCGLTVRGFSRGSKRCGIVFPPEVEMTEPELLNLRCTPEALSYRVRSSTACLPSWCQNTTTFTFHLLWSLQSEVSK